MKKILIAIATFYVFSFGVAAQQEEYFNGIYAGGEVGFGDDSDASSGLYYGGTLGIRKQLDGNIVFGVEGNLGKTNLDFNGFEDVIERQSSFMATYGVVFGEDMRNLVSAGVGFSDTNIQLGEATGSRMAVSSFVGYERAIGKWISARARLTSYDAFDAVFVTAGLLVRF